MVASLRTSCLSSRAALKSHRQITTYANVPLPFLDRVCMLPSLVLLVAKGASNEIER